MDSAMSLSKEVLSCRSSTTIGSPEAATHPAIPRPAGNRRPTRNSCPCPETASKMSSSAVASRSMMELACAPKMARAVSTTVCRSSATAGSGRGAADTTGAIV
ncbi:hypothetical protein GCM10020254_17740 [Streptomyces goshikiensis]